MTVIDQTYLKTLREDLHAYAILRREIIAQADLALHHAKRSIFALHRGNTDEAGEKLAEAETILIGIQKKSADDERIAHEGAYRAALEEYAEAALFFQFVAEGSVGQVKKLSLAADTYLAGLCDVPGELYRYAIGAATRRDLELVKKCSDAASEIIGELIEIDLTSYLRTKFDQAKQAAQRLEQVVYEVTLRNEK